MLEGFDMSEQTENKELGLSQKEKDDRSEFKRGKAEEKKTARLIVILSVFLSLLLGGGIGYGITEAVSSKSKTSLYLPEQVYNYLKDNWLYAGDYEDFQATFSNYMISGMLDNDNDPYTFYTSTSEAQGLTTVTKGVYGFTSTFSCAEGEDGVYYGGLLLTNVLDGSFKDAGMERMDLLIGAKHEGESDYFRLDSSVPSALSSSIQPKDENDKVSFEYIRGGKIFYTDFLSTGNASQIPSYVTEQGIDKNGKHYLEIRIATFLGSAATGYPTDLVEKAINEYLKTYSYVDRLVLDCRGNGGGFTNQGSGMADLFLPKGAIIYQEGTEKEITKTFTQGSDPAFSEEQVKEIAVILDSGSASATELFANALKVNKRGKVYGSKSFGKGIQQVVFDIYQGLNYEGTLRITTTKIYGPDGVSIHGVGIVPDYPTNDYYSYKDNLVSTPYLEDSYRLSYGQEQNVFTCLKRIGYSEDKYQEALKSFQTKEGLNVSGEYDLATLYRLFGRQMDKYYEGFNNEVSLVEGYQY